MKFTGERFVPAKYGSIALQHYHRYAFVLSQITDLQNKIILDIACGEGYGSELLASKAKQVYGVDISDETVLHAKKTYTKSNLTFLRGDAADIPLENRSIDVVVSFETIEHHDKHDEMMSEIKRVLKEDGVFIISSPDKAYYEKYYPGMKNEFHVKELYRKEFQNLLAKYFKNQYFFLQNNMYGSIISGENDPSIYFNHPLHYNKQTGSSDELESRFNIAIASDLEMKFTRPTSLFTYDLNTEPFSMLDARNREIEALRTSYSWRIGSLIIKPFSFIKSLLKK